MSPPLASSPPLPLNGLNALAAKGSAGRVYSPAPHAHLSVPGTPQPHNVLKNTAGYEAVVFAGKKAQAARVEELIKEKGFIPSELVHNEVAWFYNNLGIDDTYFKMESVETIATHIIGLYGSKILAFTSNKSSLDIKLEQETDDNAVYIHTSTAGVTDPIGPQYERRIDEKFLDPSTPQKAFRLETYRSAGNVSSNLAQQLRCYFVSLCNFVDQSQYPDEKDIRRYSDKSFLEKVSPNTLEIYQEVMDNTLARTGPVVEYFEVEGSKERRVVIGYKQGSTHKFFSSMSDLYHFYGIYSTRKYVEQFSNGVTIISLYLNPLRGPPIEASIVQIIKEASLVYCLPDNPFFAKGTGHAVQEAAYAYSGWIFCQHFLNRLGSSYLALKNFLSDEDAAQAAVLSNIKTRFREETYTRQSVLEVINSYPELIHMLYVNFAMVHYPKASGGDQLMPTLSHQRLNQLQVLTEPELLAYVCLHPGAQIGSSL
jgi:glutamate dehydrogenase